MSPEPSGPTASTPETEPTDSTSSSAPAEPSPPPTEPLRALEDAHARLLSLVDHPQVRPLDGVVWFSAHLTAMHHVIHPAARRVLRDREVVDALRRGTVRIERYLRQLEQLYCGDALAARLDGAWASHELLHLLGEQAKMEHEVLRRLAAELTVEQQHELVAGYEHALERAPTRPHPHTPHGRRLEALLFVVNARRDRIMDTMDSRPIPTPHPLRKVAKNGRWSDYLIGRSGAPPS
jgi:hypothetical protein